MGSPSSRPSSRLFIATFADGYKRRITATQLSGATEFARQLEQWFTDAGPDAYPGRTLVNVVPHNIHR